MKKDDSKSNAGRMRKWRKDNQAHARRLWRMAYWKKKGFEYYDGIALGGMEITPAIRKQMEDLRTQIHRWNFEYYVWAAPTVPDAEYDAAMEQLKALEAKHKGLADPNSPTRRVGAPLLAGTVKVPHKVPMLSLEKAKTPQAVSKFFDDNYSGVVEPKIDGASLAIHYINGRLIRAVTRGDGVQGEEVTHNARTIRSVPLVLPEKITIEVRGEVFMKWSDFEKHNKALEAAGREIKANPRNAASGALGLKTPAEAASVPLSFIAYQIAGKNELGLKTHTGTLEKLEQLGFMTSSALPAPLESCDSMYQYDFALNDAPEIEALVAKLDKARRVQDFPTDGLVFKVDDLKIQQELGMGTTAPKWAVAFKYEPERVKATIKEVIWTVGKTGKITPVAHFEPVLIGGSMVGKASLCNANEIRRLNVNISDEVLLEKSGEIIPKVVKLVAKHSKSAIATPTGCPVCGKKLVHYKNIVDVFCTNIACQAQVQARLVYATCKDALNIDGCGIAAIKACVGAGVNTLPKLLAEKEFAFMTGNAVRKKMQEGVAKALAAPFWRKLSALCIEGWGTATCQEAASRWPTANKLADALSKEMENALGDNKTRAFDAFLNYYGDELVELDKLGFFPSDDEIKANGDDTLTGKTFCITGSIPNCPNRSTVEDEIRKRGALAKAGVGRKLDYLVVGGQPGATKLAAARRWGTTCITPEELFDLIQWQPTVGLDPNREY